jgi:tRNA U34 2-thiouridine synthase MnmA/TrmU
MNKKRAVALLSGGLDSILAIRIIMEQGIECIGIYFTSPFWSDAKKEENLIKKISNENNFELLIIPVENDYIEMIKKPKYGWGKGLNPCIDCKIYMLKKAKKIMEELDASFIITGEVLGQRPMSQHRNALNSIEKQSELKGKILRPLSAKNLEPTDVEKAGTVDRTKLFDITGRTRKKQLELVKNFKIIEYSSPAGGCLLTDKIFSKKLKDLLDNNRSINMNDITLLKYGRHFRYNGNKIIVGRNEEENKILLKIKSKDDYIFEVPDCGSPDTLLQGKKDKDSIEFASKLTALYSDCNEKEVNVKYGNDKKLSNTMIVEQINKKEVERYNIANFNNK